jgi:pimeloyl-ACP methyl ester carboxylesterase
MTNSLFDMAAVAAATVIDADAGVVTTPFAHEPDRQYRVNAHGVGIAVHEWGHPEAPPLLLIHGGLDFARTYDVFAPLIAARGWRVISWDHRCHGDSDWATLSGWTADIRDAATVVQQVVTGSRRMPVIGHSKGGAMALRLSEALPHRFSKVVNIDGIPSHSPQPDVVDAMQTRLASGELAGWLEHRQRAADGERKPDSLEGLARRRARWNPRLAHEWLCYLVTVGAKHSSDGWRWKIDPMLRPGGFGPWRPEWSLESLSQLSVPLLAVLCSQDEPMGWATRPKHIDRFLPPMAEVVTADTGHFVHIEQPSWTASLVHDFLGEPS